MALAFSRTQRLLNAHDFAKVFNNRKSYSNDFFQIYVCSNTLGHARLGLIVAKKVSKRANRRNYIKRTVREYFRLQQHELVAVDIVVRAKRAYTHIDRTQAMQALNNLLVKMACRAYSCS